jgi:methylenetetrahydrofolate dehydrogenase (NADP+) / methenyltetrahydrofolate cyclohydrolase
MIIDGKKIAEKILDDVKKEIKEKQLKIKLAVVLVGDDFSSKVYIKKKQEACEKAGIGFELFNFDSGVNREDLEKNIKEIAIREDISGIVIQLPLPENIDSERIMNLVPKEKDVEGFVSEINSPIICAIEEIFKSYGVSLEDKKIVVLGKGRLVGKPVSEWLKNQNLNFQVIDSTSRDIELLTKEADIIISGVGSPRIIKENMVKEGVVVVDIGACRENGKTVGDADFEKICDKAKCITPCIGGIGPITVACLLKNLLKLKNGSLPF